MQTIEGFDFYPLEFDNEGRLESVLEFSSLASSAERATDIIYLAHGFRNDVHEATTLYSNFLRTLRGHLGKAAFKDVGRRRFIVAGILWPSKPFREAGDERAEGGTRSIESPVETRARLTARLETLKRQDATPAQRPALDKAIALLPSLEGNAKAQNEFVKHVLSIVNTKASDGEGVDALNRRSGAEVLARLNDAPTHDAKGGTRGLGDLVGNITGAVGQFLNLTTWYVMKDRSGTVGATGVAEMVRQVAARNPGIRTHLVGHSLGARLMASCAKSLAREPRIQPDSLTLLEGAFSHFGFSVDNGKGTRGFFRDVIDQKVVKGPFVSTFSAQDTVVGRAYSIMSRLAKDNSRDIGDASDEYGGIGRNGALRTAEVLTQRMRAPGSPYEFTMGVINNLDGSDGFVKDHSDVTNDADPWTCLWV